MKILYVASLTPNDSAMYRLWALERLGHQIVPLSTIPYRPSSAIMNRVAFRLAMGPHINRFNRDVIERAEREKPDLLWTDKSLWMWPRTLGRVRSLGVPAVSYMIDNPFGPRRDPGWRLYMKCIPHYDLHVVQRDKNIADYRSRGARDVIKIQTAYEPTVHFPPPEGWSDRDRNRDVSFVGTPYDDRAETLTRLSNEFDVAISGNPRQWQRAVTPEAFAKLYREGELFQQKYREAIWRSKINLSFITHSNQDEFVHKSFEIAACGGFLLAERSQGHMDRFVEGEEAAFFTGYDELVAKIRRYLPDETVRERIAAAGKERALRSGYYNDRQVSLILERVESILAARKR
ncbi:MAG TPA: glycosyltransferase [Edaphobacter sp.]|nr:glycosyltransferase [Edaphobacter sp.]